MAAVTGERAYQEALRQLWARRPEHIAPGLERILALAEGLGRPERSFPAVHITGTNGKTSVAHMVASILQAHGVDVGTYTSPHLQDVRERIRLAGEPVSRASFVATYRHLHQHLLAVDDQSEQEVTFFEALTALAIQQFRAAEVDVAVVEVGMGGRWDATNIVDGRVAVINRVALDHAELGSTLRDVAAEKAGIIKKGAVIVSARQAPSAARMIVRECAVRRARLLVAGTDIDIRRRRRAGAGQTVDIRVGESVLRDVFVPLQGAHQAGNAALAIAASEALLARGFGGLHAERLRVGLAAARCAGRLEVVHRPGEATVLLDGAHNVDGAHALAAALQDEFDFRRRVFVLGVLGDKDVEAMVALLAPLADAVVLTVPPTGRAAPVGRLRKALVEVSIPVESTSSVDEALALAADLTAPGDVIVVTGSLYLVGAARTALHLEPG